MQIDNSNLIECSCLHTDTDCIITDNNNIISDSHSNKELHHSNTTGVGLIKLYGDHTSDDYKVVTHDSLGEQFSFVYTS